MPHTIQLHRVLKASPELVYRAFTDSAAKQSWLPPHGYTCQVQHMDAKPGGTYAMSFTHFASGHTHAWQGKFLVLEPHSRIVYTDRFDDPNLPGDMTVSVRLQAVAGGTDLSITQEGVPDVIPPDMCYLGWQDSLLALARLVEAPAPQ